MSVDQDMGALRKELNAAVARSQQLTPRRGIAAGPLPYGHESGEIAPPLRWTINMVLSRALKRHHPDYHIGLDFPADLSDSEDALPQALLFSQPGEHFHEVVPITWTSGTVTIGPGRNGYERTIIRAAPNAGERLVDALALVAAAYFAGVWVR